MARDFNQNRVTNAKLGRKALNKFGANFAINYGLDGFNIVDIQTSEAPDNIVEYFEGNDTYEVFGLPTNITKLCSYALASFPSITDLYLFTNSVIDIEDDLSYLTNLTAIYVPTDLLSAYQTQYANVPNILDKLGTIPVDYELTIPVYDNIGNVLNEQAITYFLSGLSQVQKDACSKLIISSDYVDYYSEVWHFNFSEVFENLDNNIYYGNTKLDMSNYIIQGSGELTAGIVETQYNGISADKVVTKVTIPLSFTSYASGSITKIEQLFTYMRYLETTYQEGVIELDMQGDIVAKIISIGFNLETALIRAKIIDIEKNRTAFNYESDDYPIIIPPLYSTLSGPHFRFLDMNPNQVYVKGITSTLATWYITRMANMISVEDVIVKIVDSRDSNFCFRCENLKRVTATFTSTGNYSCNLSMLFCYSLEKLILNNFKDGNINISESNLLSRQALIDLFNSLGTPSTQKTINIGATNLAKLSAEDIAIATNKGWLVQQ